MCFDLESSPPIEPISGASVGNRHLILTAADGNRYAAFEAFSDRHGGSAVVILPDVRGLFLFYEELAIRFAEAGHDALAFDYFGRTAGLGTRGADFLFADHVAQTTFAGVNADVEAAVAHLRTSDKQRKVFTIGFCFGGSNSWHQAANGLGLAGVIGFYGHPARERPAGAPAVVDRVGEMTCPVLALMGGEDPGIPAEVVSQFRSALDEGHVPNEVITYPGAPHSFFDRKHEEFTVESADAWKRVLSFVGSR